MTVHSAHEVLDTSAAEVNAVLGAMRWSHDPNWQPPNVKGLSQIRKQGRRQRGRKPAKEKME